MAGEKIGLVVRTDSGPGILHQLTGVIARHNANITSVEIVESRPPTDTVYFEIELPGETAPLAEDLRSLSVVKEASVVAPVYRTALAVATKVRDGTTASSPGPRPTRMHAKCKAAVPFVTAIAYFAPTWEANSSSNSWVIEPIVSHLLRSTSFTAAPSSGPKSMSASGIRQSIGLPT